MSAGPQPTKTTRLLWAVPLMGLGLSLSACGNAGGDPGGSVFQQLKAAVEVATPAGSVARHYSAQEASWTGGCRDGTGRAGWTAVDYSSQFRDLSPPSTVLDLVGARLRSLGWTRHDSAGGPRQGLVPRWLKATAGPPMLSLWVFQTPAGSDQWAVSGSWQPLPAVDNGDCA